MCYIIDAVIPADDLDCLKRLGAEWDREATYIPVFHPATAAFIESEGFEGEPVKVKIRIEVVECEEEPQEEDLEPHAEDQVGIDDGTEEPDEEEEDA